MLLDRLPARFNPLRSVRARFAWVLGGSGLLFALLLAALALGTARHELQSDAGHNGNLIAQQLAQSLATRIGARLRLVRQLADQPQLASGLLEAPDLRDQLVSMEKLLPELAWIGITDSKGVVLAASHRLLEGRDVHDLAWFQAGMQAPWIGEAHPARLLARQLPPERDGTPARLIDLAAPIHDTYGGIIGVVGAHVYWSWVEDIGHQLFSDTLRHAGMEATLLDSQQRVLIGPIELRGQPLQIDGLTTLLQSGQPQVLRWPDGRRYLTTRAPLLTPDRQPMLGWAMLVRQDIDAAYASADRLAMALLLICVCAGLIFAALSWRLADRLARPIQALADTADQLRQGRPASFEALPQRRRDEVAVLAEALHAFDQAGRQQIEQREQMAQRYLNLFNASQDAIMVNIDGRIALLNPACLSLFGAERAEQLIGTPILDRFPPELHDLVRERIRRLHANQSTLPTIELRMLRLDGSEIEVEATPAYYSDNGRPAIHVLMRDLSQTRRAARELSQAQAQISAIHTELEHRVADRVVELTRANAELDSFVYAVSHDLRAPLRAMSGFSQALLEDHAAQLDTDARACLNQITHASHQMAELIDGLLLLSRSSRGELHQDQVDLSALALQILGELAEDEPGRVVRHEVEPGLCATGDRRMLAVALRNLLGNAWKYTSRTEAAQIGVHSRQIGTCIGLCVTDNGAGFDMAHAARLFQPFQRLHRQDEFPGLGIGLTTVQRIIERHGGTITLHSQPGQGASFCFTLPGMTAASPPTDSAIPGHEDHPAG
ncbi:MAG: hypothetical protein RJA44_2426 [Pseudomonadota bacterium]